MLNKKISVILASVFFLALFTSTVVSGAGIFAVENVLAQTLHTSYSVRILPPVSDIILKDADNLSKKPVSQYTVQVSRENKQGQFLAALSTVSDDPALNKLRSFIPSSTINMEEGVTVQNATLTIPKERTNSLDPGTYKFQVQALNLRSNSLAGNNEDYKPPAQAVSNTATLLVADGGKLQFSTESASPLKNQQVSPVDKTQEQQQLERQQQQQQQQQNNPPIAKAGTNQQVNEGNIVVLDASASTDPDPDQTLTYSWEQSSPSPTGSRVQIEQPAPNSPKAKFSAPQVKEDTTIRITLTVRDGTGGQATDSLDILVINQAQDAESEPDSQQKEPATPSQSTEQKLEKEPDNRPPTAQSAATSTELNNPLKISLQGSDPDKDDKLTFIITTGPSHATIAGFDKSSGSLTYIPNTGFTGSDSIKYKVVDSFGAESNEASVAINVGSSSKSSAADIPTDTTTTSTDTGSDTATSAANISKSVEDRPKQRQEILDSKLKETRGDKIANQYIVVLKSDLAPTDTQSIVEDAKDRGAKVIQEYRKALKGFTVNVPNTESLAAILNDSEVAYAEPDVKVKAFAQTVPTGVDRVDADLSSAASGDGKGDAVDADIAILDTGIDLTHPDLNVYKHVTYVSNSGTGTAITTTTGNDDHGHGTMVAGIAAAKDNDWGSVGVAPGARLWSVKVLDSTGTGSLSSVLQGLDYVTSNANELEVADLSFGCEDCSSQTLNTAIDNAVAAGVTIVAAAGNNAKDASTFSPANHPKVIAVSAIADSDGKCGAQGGSTSGGADDTLASFSNYGPAIDMAAPGVQIYSTTKNGGYSIASGTSMAAPHVAGAAALYSSENPNASPSQILSVLRNQGTTSSTTDCDTKGHGYFDADKDGNAEPLLYATSIAPDKSTIPQTSLNASDGSRDTPKGNNVTDSTAPANGTAPATSTNGTVIVGNGSSTLLGNGTEIKTNLTSVINATIPTNVSTTENETGLVNGTFSAASHNAAAGEAEYIFARKWGTVGPNNGQLNSPMDVAIGPSGNLYVIDSSNSRVQKFNPSGDFLLKWGSDGIGDGQFPSGQARHIAVDSSENVYVSDISTDRIQKFTSTGMFITQWGTTGSNDSQFNHAEGLAVDSSGNVYVADSNNNRIQKFDSSGNFITKWGVFGAGDGELYGPFDVTVDSSDNIYVTESFNNRVQAFTSTGTFITKWGSSGNGDGQFITPTSISVDSSDNVYVTDTGIDRVQKFTSSGIFVTKFGSTGAGNGNLAGPYGIAADSSGNTIYVADTNNNRIQAFTALSECGSSLPAPPNFFSSSVYTFANKWGSTGSGDGQFKGPLGIATDYSSKVLVGEGLSFPGNSRVQKFTDSGGFVTKWGDEGSGAGEFNQARHVSVDPYCNVYVADFGHSRVQKFTGDGTFMTKWGSAGSGDGQFGSSGGGIGIDVSGFVYATDFSNNRVQKFTFEGDFVSKWGTVGAGNGQFVGPTDVAVDSTGKVYVTEVGSGNANPRVQKFDGSGNFISKWGSFGSANGQMNNPQGIGIDAADNVYVADTENGRIQKFSSTGTFIAGIGTLGSGDGRFAQGSPWDVTIDIASGIVYATDRVADRIQVFAPDTAPPTVTTTSPAAGETTVSITPCVCVTFSEQMSNSTINTSTVTLQEPDNDLVTAQVSYDPVNRIASLNPSSPLAYSTVYTATVKGGASGVKDAAGNPLAADQTWTFTTMAQPPASSDPHPFIGRWGALGDGNGQFNNPRHLDVDSAGNIYVADRSNNRVQKFRSDGIFITKWGSQGMGNGQFQGPHGVAVDSADNVYITDISNNRVQKFTSSGTFITEWGTFGTGDGQFRSPRGLAVDSAGNIYVIDFNNQRVQKFTSSGTFITKWGTFGTGDGQFNGPQGIGVDSANNVYVTEVFNTRVQKFTSNGAFITKWSTGNTFTEPRGIGIDTGDNIYVADRANHVQKFTSNGAFITKWGNLGSGDGQFRGPYGVVVNSAGNIYVTDTSNNSRIQVFGGAEVQSNVTSSIAITSVNNTTPLWDVDAVAAEGNTTGSSSGDVVRISWGDGVNTTTSLEAGGQWNANHIYDATAVGPRNIIAYLEDNSNSTNSIKATSTPFPVTVQKHPTSLTIAVPSPIVQNTTFTTNGTLKDTAYSPPTPVFGQQISFTGSTPAISPVITQGINISQPSLAPFEVVFCATCPSDAADGTFGNKLLELNVGGVIAVPTKTFKVGLTFDESVASPQFELDISLSDGSTKSYTNPRYIDESFPVEATKIRLVTVAGSTTTGSIGVASIVTGDYHGFPEEQHSADFENLAVGQQYPNPLIINGGSYFAIGRAPATGTASQTVQSLYAGSSAYNASASPTASYEIQERTADLGTSGDTAATPTAYDGTSYNQPSSYFGTGLTTNSLLCSKADPDGTGPLTITADPDGSGPASAGDIDFDGVCDIWESSSTPGNDATHRYITCPRTSAGAFIDVSSGGARALDCDNTTVKYDLCFTDEFSSVWSGQAANKLVCPTVGHKDVYVELDYMAGHDPDDAAIKDVIMAFGNAPITAQYPGGPAQAADGLGRTNGITVHVIEDESITHVTQINVWTDADADNNNDLAHIKEGTAASFTDGRFGKANERSDANGAKILNMKHYVYRWGLFAHTWGNSCGPSGMGETLGNDFLVSLGCNFGERDSNHAGTEGTRSEQAGTLMHELGHILNLRHGGPATSAVGSTNYDMNCKVNYLSVMNYVRQFPGLLPTGAPAIAGGAGTYDAAGASPITKWEGVRVNTAGSAANGDPLPAGTGTSTWPGSSLDYSRAALADLVETSLGEGAGVQKPGNVAISPAQKVVFGPSPNTQANTGANLNWNLDGDTADTVSRDINNVGVEACMATSGQTQKSYDDWSNLKFYMLHDTDTRDGAVSPISQPARTPELSAAVVEHMKEEAPPQFAGVLQPINQDGTSIFKLGSSVPIKLQLKDTDNQFITDAQLTFTAVKISSSVSGSVPETEVATTFTAGTLFTYDSSTNEYHYNWKSQKGSTNQGTWAIRVYENYGTPDQRLLQGPQPPTDPGVTVSLSLRP